MPILKHRKQLGFVQIPNILAQNTQLSYEALGVLVNLLSRPEDWKVNKVMFKNKHCGSVMLNRIFKELKDAGYLKLIYIREGNRIVEQTWLVSDEVMPSIENEQKTIDNLDDRKPCDKETLTQGNQPLQIKNNINKEESLQEKELPPEKPSFQYSSDFSNVWDNIYPHTSDKGSKPQTYKNWNNLLAEGKSIRELIGAASNYKRHCKVKQTTLPYKCSNFYGRARYFEAFIWLNLTQLEQEKRNERRPRTAAEMSSRITDAFNDMPDIV